MRRHVSPPELTDDESAFLMALRRAMDEKASAERFAELSSSMTAAIFRKNSAKKELLDPERRSPGHSDPPSCELSLAMRGATKVMVGKAPTIEQADALASLIDGETGRRLDTMASGLAQEPLARARSSLSAKLRASLEGAVLDASLPETGPDEQGREGTL